MTLRFECTQLLSYYLEVAENRKEKEEKLVFRRLTEILVCLASEPMTRNYFMMYTVANADK